MAAVDVNRERNNSAADRLLDAIYIVRIRSVFQEVINKNAGVSKFKNNEILYVYV